VFASADHAWEDATKRVTSRSSYDHDAARTLLDDLLAAAVRHAARAAFELRLAELRADTAKFRRFWQRWDALPPRGPSPRQTRQAPPIARPHASQSPPVDAPPRTPQEQEQQAIHRPLKVDGPWRAWQYFR
jgi:hypothetical protein